MLDFPPTVTDEERAYEWADQLDNLLLDVGPIVPRTDLRRRAAACVRGLLAPLSRKNGWRLAEHAGDAAPHGQQHLLSRARWDADELRDFVRRYIVQGLDDDRCGLAPGRAGVLVIDEAGFAKKGRTSAGAARQFTGCLGGVFPGQVGVVAVWATARGQGLIDRELYLPREWTQDPHRCRAAHIPHGTGFATKPRLAGRMVERTLPDLSQGRVWVAADEVCGRDGAFRASLEAHRLPYAVTVQANHTVLPRPGWRHIARLVERTAAEQDWVELPAGPSPLDTRVWQWWVRRAPDTDSELGDGAWARWIIARRRADDPGGRDYFLAWGPEETPVEELVTVPGARWRGEEAIRLATSACGLADYEVRSYGGWYRHISLAMLAAAFLAVHDARAASEPQAGAAPPAQRGGDR